MFGYAASLYYARKWGKPLVLLSLPRARLSSYGYPRPFQLSRFRICSPVRTASLIHRFHQTNIKLLRPAVEKCNSRQGIVCLAEPREFAFHPNLNPPEEAKRIYIRGYWQAYGYAHAMENELREDLRLRDPATGRNEEMLGRIQCIETTVSIHVRRGDYLNVGMSLGASYYRRAIRYMSERFPDATFVFFSDEIEFVRESIGGPQRAIFVDCNREDAAYEDLRLMSACTHHVIANSTFSWWGAWLDSKASKVVIAPKNWDNSGIQDFSELYPPEWVLIDN